MRLYKTIAFRHSNVGNEINKMEESDYPDFRIEGIVAPPGHYESFVTFSWNESQRLIIEAYTNGDSVI